ncbi:hypothetical protein BRADI_1g29279v3 [Brachypodium distachyon]|uniref:DUF7595 domain-containing protein n=1 Tax=Brachypodium distachyon TaxID=15368 RepID=A0A2K2DLW7_BRADI|nr:hypothetical protein BRADI_1g29279v3 [Brachypodium distachyon]
MAPPRKRQRNNASSSSAMAPASPIEWKLPADLLLEIIARSDPSTLESCAATCKLLRRDILSPFFLHRITTRQDCAVPPCILAYLDTTKTLSLVHPINPAAASFFRGHLKRFTSRVAVLDQYHGAVASRHGLVVFRRRLSRRRSSNDLCVYDAMTGAHTFLSYPPNIPWNNETSELYHKYVLLTAADGIDRSSSFMLLVAELKPRTVRVQTFDGSCGVWGPVVACEKHLEFPRMLVKSYCEPAVLHGGVIHWLATHDHDGNTIPTYDIRSTKRGTTKLPPATAKHKRSHLHLGTSPEGKLLAIDGFMISVWLQLSDGGWGPEAVIDVEEKLRSLKPLGGGTGGGRGAGGGGGGGVIVFDCSGDRNANAVLLRLRVPDGLRSYFIESVIVLDLETKEMHKPPDLPAPGDLSLPTRRILTSPGYWLASDQGNVALTYDIRSTNAKLPPATAHHRGSKLHLGTSPDGKLLKLLAIDGFIMSVWLQLPDDNDPAMAVIGR